MEIKQNSNEKVVDIRKQMSNYIKDANSRVLEIGPLNRCLLDRTKYKNYFFADIKSTDEIRELYSKSTYLEKTGLKVDTESIIDIDFVIKDSYKKTFKDIEKFDFIIVSHVLEHIPDLLGFFIDIQNIMKDGAEIIIIYPDRRFCFDYFRSDSRFSDIHDIYKNGYEGLSRQVLDFYTKVLPENNPLSFWDIDNNVKLYSENEKLANMEAYLRVKEGQMEGDVHYWPFSDFSFIQFLYDCKIYGYLDFSISKFIPTQYNTQEFLVILSTNGTSEREAFESAINRAKEYYNNKYYHRDEIQKEIEEKKQTIKDLGIKKLDLEQKNSELEQKHSELEQKHSELGQKYSELGQKHLELGQKYSELEQKNSKLQDTKTQLEKELIERSRIKYMIKSTIIKILKHIVRLVLYIPRKLVNKLKKVSN